LGGNRIEAKELKEVDGSQLNISIQF